MTRLADNAAALREPEFRKLFLGQATSVVGVMFTIVALPFAVLEIGGTATDIGIVEAANLVPLAVFLLIGGVWADRLPRQKVMLVADFLRFGLQCATAALLIAGVAEVWHLALLQVGMGISEAFFRPAAIGLVPQVVSAARLQQANALSGLVMSVSITLGAVSRRPPRRRRRTRLGHRHRRTHVPCERMVPLAPAARRPSAVAAGRSPRPPGQVAPWPARRPRPGGRPRSSVRAAAAFSVT